MQADINEQWGSNNQEGGRLYLPNFSATKAPKPCLRVLPRLQGLEQNLRGLALMGKADLFPRIGLRQQGNAKVVVRRGVATAKRAVGGQQGLPKGTNRPWRPGICAWQFVVI